MMQWRLPPFLFVFLVCTPLSVCLMLKISGDLLVKSVTMSSHLVHKICGNGHQSCKRHNTIQVQVHGCRQFFVIILYHTHNSYQTVVTAQIFTAFQELPTFIHSSHAYYNIAPLAVYSWLPSTRFTDQDPRIHILNFQTNTVQKPNKKKNTHTGILLYLAFSAKPVPFMWSK